MDTIKVIKSSLTSTFLMAIACFSGQAMGQGFSLVNGFKGDFAPHDWNLISDVRGIPLVDTSYAPDSVKIYSYRQWAKSISGFAYSKRHQAGTVSFSYSTSGATSVCPASYRIGVAPGVILPAKGPQVSFYVSEDSAFAFALNGQNKPGNYGCQTANPSWKPSYTTSFMVKNFQFTPVPGFAGYFAPKFWTKYERVGGLINTSKVPDTIALTGILTDSIGGAKASFLYQGNHPAGTVKFNYSFLGQYTTSCWASYQVDTTKTQLPAADPGTPATMSIPVTANQTFGFVLNGPSVDNNGCQVNPNQRLDFTITQFVFTP